MLKEKKHDEHETEKDNESEDSKGGQQSRSTR